MATTERAGDRRSGGSVLRPRLRARAPPAVVEMALARTASRVAGTDRRRREVRPATAPVRAALVVYYCVEY
jgi:hypothetical protein